MHLAWRWFTGLGFDQEIPHHSTFSKNRHGRFQESKLFEQLFEQIVRQCVEVGLVQGEHSVGGWQFRGSECGQGEPHSARAVGGSSPGPPHRAPVSAGSGRAEPGGRAGARAGSGIDHRSRFHLRDQGRHAGASRLLRQLSGG